jgi:hypothetical protein
VDAVICVSSCSAGNPPAKAEANRGSGLDYKMLRRSIVGQITEAVTLLKFEIQKSKHRKKHEFLH